RKTAMDHIGRKPGKQAPCRCEDSLYPRLFCNWLRGEMRQIIERDAPIKALPAIDAEIASSQEIA
ncbi:MAG TPA: hypothetical protein VGT07_12535, partial [Steroidobacteraceae bacterium]|nr:hypothetical protein [Steroidobacteraceae bacterium]